MNGTLGTILQWITGIAGVAGVAWAAYLTYRAKWRELDTTEATKTKETQAARDKAELDAKAAGGTNLAALQKNLLDHDVAALPLILKMVTELKGEMKDERERCERDKKDQSDRFLAEILEVRGQHADCMEKHAAAMAEMGGFREWKESATKSAKSFKDETRAAQKGLEKTVAEVKGAVDSVIVNATAGPLVQMEVKMTDAKTPPPEDKHLIVPDGPK